jgi:hypothetical protein
MTRRGDDDPRKRDDDGDRVDRTDNTGDGDE